MMSEKIIEKEMSVTEYAVFQRGTFQYFAIAGQDLELPYIDISVGDKYTFSEVLLIVSKDKTIIGEPLIKNSLIEVEVIAQEKTKKQYGLKYKAKSRYRRRYGYRQKITTVKILSIKGETINLKASVKDVVQKVNKTNIVNSKIVKKEASVKKELVASQKIKTKVGVTAIKTSSVKVT